MSNNKQSSVEWLIEQYKKWRWPMVIIPYINQDLNNEIFF
jgi:hypothetical protein